MAQKGSWSTERLLTAGKKVLERFSSSEVGTHASSAAYYFFMSFIPVVIIIACIVSYLGLSEDDMVAFFLHVLPAATGDTVTTIIHEAYDNSSIAFTVSLVGLLGTASRGAQALSIGLNATYGVTEERSWLKRIVIDLLAVVVLIAFIIAGIYLIFNGAAIRSLSRLFPQLVGPDIVTVIFHSLRVFAAAIIVFALCYTYLASGERPFKKQLPGAVVAAIGWLIFTAVFRVYMDCSDHYTLIYGSLATIAIFLFWLYWILFILLVGGLFNRCLQELRDAE